MDLNEDMTAIAGFLTGHDASNAMIAEALTSVPNRRPFGVV